MVPFKKIRCFASILLVVIVLFHILMCVDAGLKFKSFGRRPVLRPMKRPFVMKPMIRPSVIRPGARPVSIKPSSNPSPMKGTLVHQPFTRPISRTPSISSSKPSPLKGTLVHQPFSRPISRPPSISPSITKLQTPTANVNPNQLPPKPLPVKPTVPLKAPSSAMVLYKRPSTSQVKLSQDSSINPGSSSAASSSSHSATHQNTFLKPMVPLKTPSSITKPFKPPQTLQLIQNPGTKLSRPSRPALITNKPTAPEQSISKITTTNVQGQSKPITGASNSNYPVWANPYLKPQASGRLNSLPSSSLGTKPLTSSSSLTPYKMAQNKPSQESIIKPQNSGLISSSPHVTSAVKPKINAKPYTPYQGTSHSTSGSSSLIKPSTNGVKPGSSTTSHGHPHHKPLPQTPSTANQAASHHQASPIHEPAISSSQASSAMSRPNSDLHHKPASAPITSTSQIQSSYPGANHPTNAANYVPQHPQPPIQIVNHISNSATPMGQYGGSQMGQYGGSQMGGYGGSGMSGIGRIVAESAIHSVVNTGIHNLLNPSEPSNFNYATVPINPDLYQQPQVPVAAPSAPAEGTSIVHNNYYIDPNSANGATQGEATSSQTLESGHLPVNYGSNQNPISTQPWMAGNVEATNGQQLIGQSFVEQNGNLPPSDEENGNLSPSNEENGNLPPSDEENGNLPPSNEENGNLPPSDEENGNLPPSDEENGNLPPSDEQNRIEQTFVEVVPVDNSELWELTETIFGYEVNISQYINLNLQVSEFDSVAAIEATEPLLNVQEEAKAFPTIKALTDLFDNYEDDPTKIENIDTEKEDALLDEFLKTDAMITAMQFLEDRNYIAPNQWKETLQQLWMRRYENSMSGFERIFLAEKSSDPDIFGGQNWIYFDHQEQSNRIKYMNYQNSLNLADVAHLLKVNYQFDNVDQKGKAMLVGTSPHLEMALYTVCHYVRVNTWCTVSLADTKFGINTHAWIYEGKEMLDVGSIDF